jgi:hypothetical protein
MFLKNHDKITNMAFCIPPAVGQKFVKKDQSSEP